MLRSPVYAIGNNNTMIELWLSYGWLNIPHPPPPPRLKVGRPWVVNTSYYSGACKVMMSLLLGMGVVTCQFCHSLLAL